MRLFRGLEEAGTQAPNQCVHGTPQPQPSLSYASTHTQQRAPSDQIFRQQGEFMLPTPPGAIRTPPGAIDTEMFMEEKPAVGSNANQVSFDNDMPYDESAEFLSRSDTRLV